MSRARSAEYRPSASRTAAYRSGSRPPRSRGQQRVNLFELVELFQLPGANAGFVLSELDALHAFEVGDQRGQFAALRAGMIVADVLVDIVSGAFPYRGAFGGDLFHDEDVEQVFPGHRVRAELGPGAAVFGGHHLAEQLVGVVLRGKLDDVASRLPLPLGQHLEDRALADPAAADHDTFRPGADPLVGLGFDEILTQATLNVTFRRRCPEIDPGNRHRRQADASHGPSLTPITLCRA